MLISIKRGEKNKQVRDLLRPPYEGWRKSDARLYDARRADKHARGGRRRGKKLRGDEF